MKAVQFKEQNQEVGKDQTVYPTTPIKVVVDGEKIPVYSKWQPSEKDLERLKNGGHVWLVQHTVGQPMQRTYLTTEEPDFKKLDKEAGEKTAKIMQHLNEKMKVKRDEKTKKVDFKKLRNKMKGNKNGNK